MVDGTVLVIHTDVVSGRGQNYTEEKWTILDRIKASTHKVVSLKARILL